MFLNSLFNTSSTLSGRMDVSDTRKLDQTKGARQSWSCWSRVGHGIFFLRLCLRAPSLNAVYVISVSQALITTARRLHEAEYRLCWFYRFFCVSFRFRFFFETASPQMRVDYITEVIWIVIRIQQKVLVAVPNLAPSTLPTILHQNRVGRVLGTRFDRYLAITRFIYNAVTTKDPNYRVIARLHCI